MADEKQTSDSSSDELNEQISTGQVAENVDANSADSSVAAEETDANSERSDLLNVVRDAVTKEGEGGDETSEQSSGSESDPDAEKESESAESEEEGDKSESEDETEKEPPFHKHPGWQRMKRQRDEYKASHENYQQIQEYMKSNDLSAQEVAEGFRVMALLKTDPAKAAQLFQSYVDTLKDYRTDHIPDDIQKRVEEGLIDQESAQELAQARAQANSARHQSELSVQRQQRERQEHEAAQTQSQVQQMAGAVTEWEQRVKQSDPEYASYKAPMVEDRVRGLVASGEFRQPQNPQEAVALADKALKDVNTRLKSLAPKKPASNPMPSGGPANRTAPEPQTMEDVVNQALGQG